MLIFSVETAVPPDLMYATIVYRLLYDLALDLFDRPNVSMTMLSMRSPSLSRQVSGEPQVDMLLLNCTNKLKIVLFSNRLQMVIKVERDQR